MKALSRGVIGVRTDPIRSGLATIAAVLAVVGAIESTPVLFARIQMPD